MKYDVKQLFILYRQTLSIAAPESFDSREEWSSCNSISTVWDQANCGSCWAVGASGAISDRICIHKGTQTMVSAQQLMTCCHGIFNGGCGQGCNGGYLLQAWEYWKNTGLVSGGGYGRTDTCQPYSLAKCDHHVKGPYGPCPASVPTPACKSGIQPSFTLQNACSVLS